VAGAWEILNELDAGGQMMEITGRASVRHPYSHLLPTPHEGEGLYERDLWNVGDSEERTLTLTRASGPRGPMEFQLSWAGNDHGTFSAQPTVTLPLNEPVAIPITIAPKEHGALTAHLTLHNREVPGYAYRTLVTIIAPENLTASNDFSVESKAEVPRPGIQSFFYRVPPGLTALKLEASWGDRAVSMSVSRPDTRSQRGEMVTPSGGRSAVQVVTDPTPGVWEVRLSDIADTRTFDWEQAKKDEPVPPTEATLKVTAFSTQVELVTGAEPEGRSAAGTHEVWITNRMAEFHGGAANTPVASAHKEEIEISENSQRVFEVEVLPGSTALLARAFDVSDPEADLDVYIFDCSDEEDECQAARVDGDPVGEEYALVLNPDAGLWKIVVDAPRLPAGAATFQYMDAVFNPTYGVVSTTDTPQERARGARWMAKAHTWLAPAVHAEGRAPMAALQIRVGTGGGASFLVSLTELELGGSSQEVEEEIYR
jgi:hypothetical protein